MISIKTILNNCTTVCLVLLVTGACAQNSIYSDVSIASPTVASLGKFTDIPVSYHTGLPQISIPIYTVKEGPLSLPIGLSYHAGGVKVMEPAGWVGTGWTLNAGGVITRSVRGIADEALNTAIGMYGHFRNYGFGNYLTIGPNRLPQDGGGPMPHDYNFGTQQYDGEPDLFFFNFNGYSGKFYFQNDRTAVMVGGEDLKIECYYPMDTMSTYTHPSANIQGFTVTVPNGDKYYFGINPGINSGVDAVEIAFPYSNTHSNITDKVFSSWYLTKIVSGDGLFSINFSYVAESYSYFTIAMYPIGPDLPFDIENPFANVDNKEYNIVKNYIDGVRLSQISFSNGAIDFIPASTARTDLSNHLLAGATYADNANTQAKALQSISISSAAGVCKKYNFYYNYFTDNTNPLPGTLPNFYSINSDRYRLRLDSLREQSCDGSLVLKPYKFDYYGAFLPRRISFAQDHWGFYNGANANSRLIPTYTIKTFNFKYGANRESKWPEMAFGSLTRIVYPTGGNSSFEMEPHTTRVNATRYTETYRGQYSVGYDGSYTANWTNVPFAANTYRIIISNGSCPNPPTDCSAGIHIKTAGGVQLAYASTGASSSDTIYVAIPAGNHKIEMVRNDVGGFANGAQATIHEMVPSQIDDNVIVGGLRIKRLIASDSLNPGNRIITSYNYDFNGKSTGMLYSRPRYVQIIRNELVQKFGIAPATDNDPTHDHPNGCPYPEWPNNHHLYFESPCGIVPMSTTQGNHIGYNEVTVTQSGSGKSVYRYYGSGTWDNVEDDIAYRNVNPLVCDLSAPFMPAPPLPFEYKRGELKYEGHFNEAGQVLRDAFYLIDYDSTLEATPGYIIWLTAYCGLSTRYEIKGYWKNRTEQVLTNYVPGGLSSQTTSIVYHESAFHHQPTRKITITPAAETFETKMKYASDFRISTCESIPNCMSPFTTTCTNCDATTVTTTGGCTTIRCKYWANIDNFICRSNAKNTYTTCRRNGFSNPANTYKTCMTNAKSTADAQLKPILALREEFNNSLVEQSNWKNNQLTGAVFTVFNYATNPATEVYPSKTQQVHLTASSPSFTAAATSANNISVTKDSRYADEATLKINAGNLVELTPKSGVTTNYIWDYKSNFPIAKTTGNVLNAIVAYSSFESDGNGNWTIGSTGRITTDGITGKQCYQLSSGAVSRTGMISGTSYIVSYWTKNATAFTITGTQGAAVQGKTIAGWTYYEHTVTGVTQVSLSGSGLIDELRLYPAQAQMITYTYDPLRGMTSQCDINNVITYYEYDALSRLKLIRDQDKNVIKTIDYKYGGIN